MSYLLDTNVISEWRKASPDEGVVGLFETVRADVMFLSVVTLGEIRRGITLLQLRGDHHQAARYGSWLTDLRVLFADRLIPIGVEEMEEWGHGDARQPVSMADGLVAATARVRGWAVVTRNVKNFEGTGVRVLNPFIGAN